MISNIMGDSTNGNSSGTRNTNCGNTINSYNNTWNNCIIAAPSDRKREILEWLSPLESQGNQPEKRHHDVCHDRVDGIGDWVLETDQFLKWRDCEDGSVNRTLFCRGDPGAGKTYLSSLVIDGLSGGSDGDSTLVIYFYCNFQTQKSQVTAHMLISLLKQAVGALDVIPEEIDRKAKQGSHGGGLSVPEILRLLQVALRYHKRTFICIDALDECGTGRLSEFLRSLRSIVTGSPNVRLFVTGRPHIQAGLEEHYGRPLQIIKFKPVKGDIRRYLEKKLEDDEFRQEMDSELKAHIMEKIPEKISEIFLVVSLSIAAILQEPTLYQRKQKLREMASGLGLEGAYGDAMRRIREQSENRSKLAMQALMWVSRSQRPLRVDELRYALAVEIGSTHLDPDNISSIQTISSCCLGLITVDEEASTVRLIHFTLHVYLCEHLTLFSSPDGTMAEVCLTYLNLQCIKDRLPLASQDTTKTPLLQYASYYWGIHAGVETTAVGKSLAIKLLDQFDTHISARLLLSKIYCDEGWLWDGDAFETAGFTRLHVIAFFGNTQILTALPRIKAWDVNRRDFTGRTPLIWAAARGNLEVTKTLLGLKGILGWKRDNNGRTALSWAAGNGHQEVVRVLRRKLECRGTLYTPDYHGLAPVHFAAESGREDMVNLLLKKGVWVNQVDQSGRTALSLAAENGHEGVVKVLLRQKNISADTADKAGITLLSWAASGGFGGVVALLLERKEVNPNTTDIQYGRTPLSWAAGNGYEIVTKLLLAHNDIDPELADNEGLTPLSWAARDGHEEVIKVLAERAERTDASPETRDIGPRTPISWATEHWHGIRCISQLEENGFGPDLPDLNGRTLLSWAAGSGNVGFVQYLLNRKDVDPNLVDKDGQTPLWWAAEKGNQQAVQLLLERADVNANLADRHGQTPLSRAIEMRSQGTVQLLLERANVDPNFADKYGRTPLLWAIYELTLENLQPPGERADIDPNLIRTDGQTLLCGNRSERIREIVQHLFERPDVDPNFADDDGLTPLLWAAANGTLEAVQLLLEQPDVNPNLADIDGRTPLSWAVVGGRQGVVQLLLERPGVDPNLADKDGGTPLLWAVAEGRQGIIQLLLERANVDPNLADKNGRTPLSWAAAMRSQGAVDLLLKRRDVDPNLADKDGRTPLSWVAERWYSVLLPSGSAKLSTRYFWALLQPGLMFQARLGDPVSMELLLISHGINPQLAANDSRTPRWLANELLDRGTAQLLLKPNDVDPNVADNDGRKPGSWLQGRILRWNSSFSKGGARLFGTIFQPHSLPFDTRKNPPAIKFLLEHDADPDLAVSDSVTLWLTAERRSKGVVQLLLKRNDIDLNLADKDGRTPLSWAAGTRNCGAQKALLAHAGIDPYVADKKGRTPVAWAVRSLNCPMFVRLLQYTIQ